jgi:hypothetical protein
MIEKLVLKKWQCPRNNGDTHTNSAASPDSKPVSLRQPKSHLVLHQEAGGQIYLG